MLKNESMLNRFTRNEISFRFLLMFDDFTLALKVPNLRKELRVSIIGSESKERTFDQLTLKPATIES